MELTSI